MAITKIALRQLSDDVASKAYVNSQVSALGNAFNYVGTVAGGANAGAALDLALQTQKDAGDYYKVSTAGYFKVGEGTAFYANQNDGIVWNLSSGVDVIDNTNSTVAGTTDYVSVSGSADTGYTVDIASAFKTRMSTAETNISNAQTAISNAQTAITNLQGQSSYRRETPSGTINGTNAEFTLANTPIAATVQVYLNGLLQEATDDYTLSGTTVTFVSAPLAGDKIRAIYYV